MNPFSLSGPGFLFFYAFFAAIVLSAYWVYVNFADSPGGTPRLTALTADPYRIAFLRGAAAETVRVAIVNLIDRGLLETSGGTLSATGKASDDLLRRPLEQAILARCARAATFETIVSDPATAAACAQYDRQLQETGLLRDGAQRAAVNLGMQIAIGLLGGIAGIRVAQALSHGRFNIAFLVVLAVFVIWVATRIRRGSRRTGAGSRMIHSLETLMARLKSRAGSLLPGGATQDALLLAAVFGLYALPASAFPFVETAFPKPQSASSNSGSSGGDSCGSSCGSSSGSSCGGGGGCGGCGGD